MTVKEMVRLLEVYPAQAEVRISDAPGRTLDIVGHTASMEHDAGELCQPLEVLLLVGDAWRDVDLDCGSSRAA